MKEKLRQFMSGRYGTDQLSRFTMICALIALVINTFTHLRLMYYLAWVLLILTYFRALSRNYQARYAENMKFMALRGKVTAFLKPYLPTRTDSAHRIFKCPACKQKVRVPRGRGKISISCPKCHTSFIKRT